MFILTDDMEKLLSLTGPIEGLLLGSISSFDGSEVCVRWLDNSKTTYTYPNMLCIGLVATPEYRAEPILNWWKDRTGTDLDVFVLPSASNLAEPPTLMLWLLSRVFKTVGSIVMENRDLVSQNMQLRRTYESLQTAFARLENFVVGNQLHEPVLQYQADKISSFWQPTAATTSIAQVLPVLSTRLSSLEIFLRKVPGAKNGSITLTLRLEPAARVWHVWEIEYHQLVDGWNNFSPPPIVHEPNEVVLEVKYSEFENAPALGLSTEHWNATYAATVMERDGRVRGLALRVWSGFAGVRAAKALSASFAQGNRLSIPASRLLRATYVGSDGTEASSFVEVDDGAGRLVVRSHGRMPTIVVVPGTIPLGTTFVSAQCKPIDPVPVECAVAIVSSSVHPDEIFSKPEPVDGFSGWLGLSPGSASRLNLHLDRPTEDAAKLYLAARLPKSSPEGQCRSSWSSVEVYIEPKAESWGANKSEPVRTNLDELSENVLTSANAGPRVFRFVSKARRGEESLGRAEVGETAGPNPAKKKGRSNRPSRRS